MFSQKNNLARITAAWQGCISGCFMGKPLEILSFQQGLSGVQEYLHDAPAMPVRDYAPSLPNGPISQSLSAGNERFATSLARRTLSVAEAMLEQAHSI